MLPKEPSSIFVKVKTDARPPILKDLLGLRTKRSKSVGTGLGSSIKSVDTSGAPPLPKILPEVGLKHHDNATMFAPYTLTPEEQKFNDSLPDLLIFSVDTVVARTTWINFLDIVLVDPSEGTRKAEVAQHPTASTSLITSSSTSPSPHLSVSLNPSTSPLISSPPTPISRKAPASTRREMSPTQLVTPSQRSQGDHDSLASFGHKFLSSRFSPFNPIITKTDHDDNQTVYAASTTSPESIFSHSHSYAPHTKESFSDWLIGAATLAHSPSPREPVVSCICSLCYHHF